MSFYRQQLEEWLKTLDIKADVVFDIGGAQGEVASRVNSWDVQKYEVRDLPKWDIEARSNNGWHNPHYRADVVFCLEVFEYIVHPVDALSNIKGCLKEGGRAYVTFQFVYPHHNELHLDSLRYTESAIKRMANMVKLEIKNIWYRTDRSGLLQSFYMADGMHPSKSYKHHNVTGFIVEFQK